MSRIVATVAPPRLGAGFRWLLGSSWISNLGDGIAIAAASGPSPTWASRSRPSRRWRWRSSSRSASTRSCGARRRSVRQRAVPTDLQGRVGSVNTVGVFGGLVVGSAVGGLLAQAFGVTAPFWFAFAGSAVFLVLIWGQLAHIAHEDDRAE